MKIIDLRSDTVTLPTDAMREAIFKAELGDDVFGEDPTTIKLEQMAAQCLGKEAALLVSSGTMANLVSLLTHCQRGDEVILGNLSHTYLYEAGGIAALGSIHPRAIPNEPDGTMLLNDIETAIRSDNVHFPRTRLICLENTHNLCNGAPLTPEYITSAATLAQRQGIMIHIDGARIFNASVSLGVNVQELTRHADSVSFCLSKGLAAPIGSLVCGSEEFIVEARRIRKVLGGGMRQCGIISAAGIVALEEMVERIEGDHLNAHRLADGIANIADLSIAPENVKTNIVFFHLNTDKVVPETLLQRLEQRNVKILYMGHSCFRMVTHYGINEGDCDYALTALTSVMQELTNQ